LADVVAIDLIEPGIADVLGASAVDFPVAVAGFGGLECAETSQEKSQRRCFRIRISDGKEMISRAETRYTEGSDLVPMLGRTILHYQLLEKLGEGGMGAVYKAQDARLNRFVAIKLLPESRSATRRAAGVSCRRRRPPPP